MVGARLRGQENLPGPPGKVSQPAAARRGPPNTWLLARAMLCRSRVTETRWSSRRDTHSRCAHCGSRRARTTRARSRCFHEFTGARATFGCLDTSLTHGADRPTGPVIGYEFANGCDHAVRIDLGAVNATGRDIDGRELVLRPYDPDREIRSELLDGKSYGEEAIEYRGDGIGAQLASLCVDPAAAFGGDAPIWTCFGSAP